MDFGVSLKLKKDQGSFIGTQGHESIRAPEMLNGKRYNYQIDMWAVGIIVYMCISQRHPFISPLSTTENNILNQVITLDEDESFAAISV